jgi:predicted nucleic acid-binding protein
MWLSLLNALNAVPKILSALERLGDVATAQMAQRRMENKNEQIEDIIAAATARREQRLLEREAERVQRDSGKSSDWNGGRDLDG